MINGISDKRTVRAVEIKKLYRVIDANFNRAKEGLRVCEDVCRFLYNESRLTLEYKKLRHRLTAVVHSLKISAVIKSRNVKQDIGKKSLPLELKRRKISDILYANSQRAKESVRVLEEFSKLINVHLAENLKKIRYDLYALEKKVIERIEP